MGLANDPYDSSVDYKFNRRGFNMSFSFRQDLVNMGQQVFVIDNLYISVSIALLTVSGFKNIAPPAFYDFTEKIL